MYSYRMTQQLHIQASVPERRRPMSRPHSNLYMNIHSTLFINLARRGKQPRCPLTDEWANKCGIFIQWDV